jgi:uncharacterized protein with PQ loop repeat
MGSWLAAIFLSIGYWLQVYRIHKHKEVRDLSIHSYVFFAIAYVLLGIEGWQIESTLFLVKNILVLVPTCIIIWQIYCHKDDKWQ